jgi:quinol monooxygenase YgiN
LIIIAGSVDFSGDREAAIAAGQPHIVGALTQRGCLDYAWSLDTQVEGRIQVFERWADEAALAAHFEGPHYKAMLETLGAHGLRGSSVAKYRIDLMQPVYDSTGRPRADFFSEQDK